MTITATPQAAHTTRGHQAVRIPAVGPPSALAIIDGHEDGAVTPWSALESAGRASTGQAYMVPGTVEAARAALSSTELEQATLAGAVLTMDSAVAFAHERLDKIAAS